MSENIPPATPLEIKPGTIVSLATGGPLMTVEAIGKPNDQIAVAYFERILVTIDGCTSNEWKLVRMTILRAALVAQPPHLGDLYETVSALWTEDTDEDGDTGTVFCPDTEKGHQLLAKLAGLLNAIDGGERVWPL